MMQYLLPKPPPPVRHQTEKVMTHSQFSQELVESQRSKGKHRSGEKAAEDMFSWYSVIADSGQNK